MYKKNAIILIFLLVLSNLPIPNVLFAATTAEPSANSGPSSRFFKDVPVTDPNADFIDDLRARQLIDGTSEHTFSPASPLTREQFAKMIVGAFNVPTTESRTPFIDLTSDWSIPYISSAFKAKLIDGTSNTTFNPSDSLTRQAAATIVWRWLEGKGFKPPVLAKQYDVSDTETWAQPAVQNIMALGLRTEGNRLVPYRSTDVMTRGDAAALIDLTIRYTTPDQTQGANSSPLLLYSRTQLEAFRLHPPQKLSASIKSVLRKADKYKKEKPPSVIEKVVTPTGATAHDFVSLAIYYWPDPSKPDGKPYISKDGQINPEKNDPKKYDADRMSRMISAVDMLSLSYILTGDESYAETAAKYLRVWFLDETTKMNPNMTFAQGRPGKSDGTPAGIIDGWRLISIVDSVHLIEGSKAWTAIEDQGVKSWFHDYLGWLRGSDPGKKEGLATNNHGVWYDAQIAAYAWFSGDNELAKSIVEGAKVNRIHTQIEPDGTMPLELKRTKSFHYTIFNLEAFITLARVGDQVGVDLWSYESKEGHSLKRAIDYALPYVLGNKPWERPDIAGTAIDAEFARYLAMASSHDSQIHMEEIILRVIQKQQDEELIATESIAR